MPERNPDWIRDELILALDLYVQNPKSPPGKSSREIRDLSHLLARLGQQLGTRLGPKYRNANGVYMKLMNFRRFDPEFQKEGKSGLKSGNRLEEDVWNEFAHDPERLRATADAIRAHVGAHETADSMTSLLIDDLDDDSTEAPEGTVLTREHRTRERNRKLVERKKRLAMQPGGRIFCEVCKFDYGEVYGERGVGFIECHHTAPLSSLKPGTRTKLEDLLLVCANCHRMIHVRKPWLEISELRSMLALQRGS